MQAQVLNDGVAEAITNMFAGGKRTTQAALVTYQGGANNKEEAR